MARRVTLTIATNKPPSTSPRYAPGFHREYVSSELVVDPRYRSTTTGLESSNVAAARVPGKRGTSARLFRRRPLSQTNKPYRLLPYRGRFSSAYWKYRFRLRSLRRRRADSPPPVRVPRFPQRSRLDNARLRMPLPFDSGPSYARRRKGL